MPTFLLLWDSTAESWRSAEKDFKAVTRNREPERNWACGARKNIPVGSRLFLKRTRTRVRGLVASGYSIGSVAPGAHWKGKGSNRLYVPMRFDAIVPPYSDDVLPQEALQHGVLGTVHWNTQGGGIQIPDEAANEVELLWHAHLDSLRRGRLAIAR